MIHSIPDHFHEPRRSRLLYVLIRWLLGGVFLVTGVLKLSAPQQFAHIIEAYGLINPRIVLFVAVGLSLTEVVAGLGLVLDMRYALAVILALLLFFITILGYGLVLGLDIDCGCFGTDAPDGDTFHNLRPALYRDLVMVAGVGFLYLWRYRTGFRPNTFFRIFNHIKLGGIIEMKKGLFLLCLTGIALTLINCADGKNKFQIEVDTEAAGVKLVREVQRGGYNVVTTSELKSWIDNKKDMVIVDTMPYEESYKKGHVPGAKHFLFPVPEMETWESQKTDGKTKEDFQALLGLDKNKTVVIYCGFVKCTRSHNGAAWAVNLGYSDVYRHPGGIYSWKGADYPIEK